MNHRSTAYIVLIVLFAFITTASAAPGDLDTTFSQDGKVIDTLYGVSDDQGYATAVQADGKIIVAGTLNSSRELIGIIRYHCGIARYNLDGTLDTTFDNDGKLIVTMSNLFVCRAIAVQADGKIVVGGGTSPSGGSDFALMRFNPDGTFDTSFDGDGRATTHISGYDTVTALAIQPDGKIVAAGVTNPASNSNFAAARYNSNGSLDTSFDTDGKVFTDFFSTLDYANAVAIQPDGKIVLAGYCVLTSWQDFALIRYNADGSLDTSFDFDGKLVTSLSPTEQQSDYAQAVVAQADGKIVAVGNSSGGFTVVRFNADGSFDTTFDTDGRVTTSVSPSGFSNALGAAIQPDGKILVGGSGSFPGTGSDFCLVRYNPDGSLDGTFGGGDGIVNTDFFTTTEWAHAVVLLPDGRIAAGGSFTLGSTSDREFGVARYHADGTLDTTFDGDGKNYTPMGFPVSTAANDVAVQADGKVVVAGHAYNGSNDDFMVARYNVDGSPDLTFGAAGKVLTDIAVQNPFGERATAVAIQADGKIIVAGSTNPAGNNPDFAVVRYNTNGSRDFTFDGDGIATTSFSSSEYIHEIAIQPDGKIVAVGITYVQSGTDIAVARYNTDGSLDNTFSDDGKLTTDFIGGGDRAEAVVIQSDGKIVVAGAASTGPGYDFAVLRYNADGSPDTSFDDDGKLTTEILGLNDGANALAIQADGKIVAAGTAGSFNTHDYAMVRYNSNGSLDLTFDGDGMVVTNFIANDSATGIAIQPDGRIILAGQSYNGLNNDASLARYNTDGSLDSSFGTGGKRNFDMGLGTHDYIYGMALDPSGRIVIAGDTAFNITIARVLATSVRTTPFDFDGDGKTDISIFRPSVGEWWYLKSSNGGNAAFQFGNSSDKLVPGDFTGDGKTDIAIFRPSTGEWFILRSENGSFYSFPFGASGDLPQVGDFDADGKADAALFRPSNSTWYISKSSGGTIIQQFGAHGDVPVTADYDGDGRSDIAIYRVTAGQWWINRSTLGVIALTFGNVTDKPVPADYTGDGRADPAFFRQSTGEWFVLHSETNNTYHSFPFGTNGDFATPGDYDGDGKTDAAVFRPSSSTWYVQRSTGGILTQPFGAAGDKPVPNVFVP